MEGLSVLGVFEQRPNGREADKRIVAVAPISELERSDHPWIKEYFLGPRGRAAEKNEGPGLQRKKQKLARGKV